MNRNMGLADRLLRAALGIALLAFATFGSASGTLTVILAAIGVILAATSVLSFCPLYRIVGIKTCKDC